MSNQAHEGTQDEQSAFDVEFTHMVECERTLDDVIARLADAGVMIEPWQRIVVNRWVEFWPERSAVPMACRVSMLRGMLRSARCPAP